MKHYIVTLYFFTFSILLSNAQSSFKNQKNSFEYLTGKSLYELINHYKLGIQAGYSSTITTELNNVTNQIEKNGSITLKSDLYFLKAIINMKNKSFIENTNNIKKYTTFVSKHFNKSSYKAKEKLLNAYCHFYNGSWVTALKQFDNSYLLSIKENDTLTALTSKLYKAYITCFTINETLGLKTLKKLYRDLIIKSYPDHLKKDLNVLKLEIIERILRFYRIKKVNDIDSLKKYNTLYKNEVKKVNDSLVNIKMFLMEAYISARQKNDIEVKINLDSISEKKLDFYNQKLLSEVYYYQEKYKQFISILENSPYIKNINDNNVNPWLKEEFKFLGNAYQKTNDFEKSAYYFNIYASASNNFQNIIDSVSIAINDTQSIKLEKVISKDQSKNSFFTILILFLLLFITPLFFFYYKRKKEKTHAKSLKNFYQIIRNNTIQKETKIKDKIIQNIIEGLQKLENDKFFLNVECTAYNTAKKIKTNTTYLSKVMNSHYHKSFNTYINELRIKYVIQKLKNDKRYLSYSIQSISEEIGYKSQDSFTKAFKVYTGILPSVYIKNLNHFNKTD